MSYQKSVQEGTGLYFNPLPDEADEFHEMMNTLLHLTKNRALYKPYTGRFAQKLQSSNLLTGMWTVSKKGVQMAETYQMIANMKKHSDSLSKRF